MTAAPKMAVKDRDAWIIGGLFLFIALVFAVTPRGIRNNNPGNLKKLGNWRDWRGVAPDTDQTDSTFIKFTEPFYGIRALARTLWNYQARYNLFSVKEMISRWAPSTENKTTDYIKHAAQVLGVGVNDPVNLATDLDAHKKLVAVIIQHENGQDPYTEDLKDQAIDSARAV